MTAHAYPVNLAEPPGGAFDSLDVGYQELYRAAGHLDRLYTASEMAAIREKLTLMGWTEDLTRSADPFGHYRHHPCRATSVVYFVGRAGAIKIGHSKDVESRLTELALNKTVTPSDHPQGPVTLLGFYEGGHAAEQALHHRFASARLVGEWFRVTPELLAHIAEIEYPSWVVPPGGGA